MSGGGGGTGGSVALHAPVPVVVYGAEGDILAVNEPAVAFAGADDREALLGEPVLSFVADDEDVVGERIRRVIEEREPVEVRELQLRGVDGRELYAEVAGAPVTYEGEPAGQAILQDVTEMKRREQRLRRERERFTALFDGVPEPVIHVEFEDDVPVVRNVNATFEEAFGYAADDLVGENVNEYIVPDERMETAREIDRSTMAVESVEREVCRATADGVRDFLFRAEPFDLDGSVESVGVYVDITERKEREQRIEREHERFTTLFENLPNPVVHGEVVDGEPIVRAVNPAFEETFGYPADEIVGENLDEYTIPADRRERAEELNERFIEEGGGTAEVERLTVDGRRDFRLDIVLRETDEGTHEGYSIYTDVTDRSRRERELQRQNERLDEFAGVVSHDLRGPLSVAYGNLRMYRQADEGDPKRLKQAEEAMGRMETLLDELLTLARQGEAVSDPEPVDLAEVAQGAWAQVDTADATLSVADDLTFEADPNRVQELLANLFTNAVEHAGEGATVEVGAADGGFYVADDGPGIPEDERDEIFEPGHTSAEDGSGFGLAIVEDIAEAHGWEVVVAESEAGGARFEFERVTTAVEAD